MDLSASAASFDGPYVHMESLAQDFGNLIQICAFNYLLTVIKLFKFLAVNRRLSFIWMVLGKVSLSQW